MGIMAYPDKSQTEERADYLPEDEYYLLYGDEDEDIIKYIIDPR